MAKEKTEPSRFYERNLSLQVFIILYSLFPDSSFFDSQKPPIHPLPAISLTQICAKGARSIVNIVLLLPRSCSRFHQFESGTGYGHIIRGASSPFDIAVIIMITGTPFINSVHQAFRPFPVNILAFHNPFDPVLFIPVDKYKKAGHPGWTISIPLSVRIKMQEPSPASF